jgi:diguanylate cyclase (GGDEF)-like protein
VARIHASAARLRSVPPSAPADSYRRLADVSHDVLAEHALDSVLDRIAAAVAELVPHDAVRIDRADDAARRLTPIFVRGGLADAAPSWDAGLTGRAVTERRLVVGDDGDAAVVCVPLLARGALKGTLTVYRAGERGGFGAEEVDLAQRLGDIAAIALDNADVRTRLEHQAQTDSLTGLYNHRFFHERLRSELARAGRVGDCVAVLMIDIDDFKRVNDVYGHGTGDQVLVALAELVRDGVRGSDVVCRIGGEEFAVIMPSCDAGAAVGLARRFAESLARWDPDPAGTITVSIGIAQGPLHAANPRGLVACAEAAMMAAKARGKSQVVVFEDDVTERPVPHRGERRDLRSLGHLKMLQSLAGKLNRLNDVREIGASIADELHALVAYHNCRVYVVDGQHLMPIAFRGDGCSDCKVGSANLACLIGEGITGHVAATGVSMLIDDTRDDAHALVVPGTEPEPESMVAVPLRYGARVIGVIVLSKHGVGRFDEDEVRLLEVLSGHASVALENARLYEAERREARSAKALLECAETMSRADSFELVAAETARLAAKLADCDDAALFLEDPATGDFRCVAAHGSETESRRALLSTSLRREPVERFIMWQNAPFLLQSGDARQLYPFDPVRSHVRTAIVAPLHHGAGVKGWIGVPDPEGSDGAHFTEEHRRLLAGLSHQASVALQRARLHEELHESAELANSLLEVSRELATVSSLDDALNRVVAVTARVFGAGRASIWLQESADGDLRAAATRGYEPSELDELLAYSFPAERVRRFLECDEPFVLDPDDSDEIEDAPRRGYRALIAPLRIDGRRLGLIAAPAPAPGPHEFPAAQIRLLAGVAHQAQLAIANAASYERLECTFAATLKTLIARAGNA